MTREQRNLLLHSLYQLTEAAERFVNRAPHEGMEAERRAQLEAIT